MQYRRLLGLIARRFGEPRFPLLQRSELVLHRGGEKATLRGLHYVADLPFDLGYLGMRLGLLVRLLAPEAIIFRPIGRYELVEPPMLHPGLADV